MQTICKHATCLKDANIAGQFLTCSQIHPLPSHCSFMYYRELHFTYSLVDRLLGGEANEMHWQRKSEAQIILPLLICLGWNFQQWLSPLSPSFRKIASHFVVPSLTGSSTEVLALAHQFQYRVLAKTPSPVVQPRPWMGQPPTVANYKVSLPSHVWLLSSFILLFNSSH